MTDPVHGDVPEVDDGPEYDLDFREHPRPPFSASGVLGPLRALRAPLREKRGRKNGRSLRSRPGMTSD
ncbi:hypothetical protein BRC64_12290 [Halobacteriales archaeon QH_10_67_22]|nr:MAG: hypothetical protein BRC64_12290 [Halobacteriales archaeon QH_10_67_22]